MIILNSFKNKNIAIFGLGDSGLASCLSLIKGGANVIAFDDDEAKVNRAKEYNIFIQDLREIDWNIIDSLVLAPGVPLYYPYPHWSVELARKYDVEIIGDIELFVRERNNFLDINNLTTIDCPFITVTGTNGKSTTTNLLTHLLKQAGYDVQMGGNIGVPILSLESFKEKRFYVIECSSFQIDLTPSINPTIAILLNLTPDHVDRHGTIDNYYRSKSYLLERAVYPIIAIDDEPSLKVARSSKLAKRAILLSIKQVIEDSYYAVDSKLYYQKKLLVDLKQFINLRGVHNSQNALAAIAALALFDKNINIAKLLTNYKNLPHRMELVAVKNNISYINDSKATNAEATLPALQAFDNIFWIIGGVAKEGGINNLLSYLTKVKKAYLIGSSSQDFAQTLKDHIAYKLCHNLENAVLCAHLDAKKNGQKAVILFSPACASYDQFLNYSARGDAFITYVNNLTN